MGRAEIEALRELAESDASARERLKEKVFWYLQAMQQRHGWVVLAHTSVKNQCGGRMDDTVAVLLHYDKAKQMVIDHNKLLEVGNGQDEIGY